MPGQQLRRKSVRRKLNANRAEFRDKNVLLVDDSIVRGTTSEQIIEMAREAGAKKVYLASAAPEIRFPNVYGIDMPSATELIAHGREVDEIRQIIGADGLIFQDLNDLIEAVRAENRISSSLNARCSTASTSPKTLIRATSISLILYVMTTPKQCNVRTKWKISKCITKDDAFTQGAGLAP